jgi:hypothetical protein
MNFGGATPLIANSRMVAAGLDLDAAIKQTTRPNKQSSLRLFELM